MKLELHDIDTEIKNSNGQIEALKQKISQEEKQLEQLTQTSDAAKVTTSNCLYCRMLVKWFK